MEIFQYLVDFMRSLLDYSFLATKAIGFPSYGIAIILLTIVIKLILAPLTYKQVKSMKGMAELQPKMKALQERYKDNPQKIQEETMKLYKEMGINPLAGCLPLLVQMPFLIAIFYALQGYNYAPEYAQFLWLPNLSDPDPIYVLPVLSALSTYVMSKQTSGASNQQAKIMSLFMPLFIGYISLNFASGLVMYWVVSNVFQMVQQTLIYRNDK